MAKRPRATQSPSTRFLTTRESAGRLGVTVNAIKAWIREQRLPALRTPGGHHRIAESDIIAMTAYPEGQVRERIRECGADDFLEKPFAIEKFRSCVTALLGKDARA